MVFRSTDTRQIGNKIFKKGQPVLYIDSAKTSTLEGAATSVYATGGRGNARLITWEGEKTLTFTVEDALLSPLGFSILSGAGLFNYDNQPVHIHQVVKTSIEAGTGSGTISVTEYYRKVRNADDNGWEYIKVTDSSVIDSLQSWNIGSNDNDGIAVLVSDPMADNATAPTDASAMFGVYTRAVNDTGYFIDLGESFAGKTICADAPIYISLLEEDSITGKTFKVASTVTGEYTLNSKGYLPIDGKIYYVDDANTSHESSIVANTIYTVLADFYTLGMEDTALELQINAEDFAGYFYVEADTLVRRQSDGRDLPAIITIPLAKIQSNFSIAMASSGDPSTFTFTMDAMPGYTYFNRKKKVLCAFQIINENISSTNRDAVMRDGSGYTHDGFDI